MDPEGFQVASAGPGGRIPVPFFYLLKKKTSSLWKTGTRWNVCTCCGLFIYGLTNGLTGGSARQIGSLYLHFWSCQCQLQSFTLQPGTFSTARSSSAQNFQLGEEMKFQLFLFFSSFFKDYSFGFHWVIKVDARTKLYLMEHCCVIYIFFIFSQH